MAEISFKKSLGSIISNIGRDKEKKTKMQELGVLTSKGQLSSYMGIFGIATLSDQETARIEAIFQEFGQGAEVDQKDLRTLLEISSEIKAINNQAVLMHGERVKKAQEILKKYRDGAFSAWLIATYGNRQTPYNFLQYYEFQTVLPKELQLKLDEMPRQAVYALASRDGPLNQKEQIVRDYKGEKKQELLQIIRNYFPLPTHDKRMQDSASYLIDLLSKAEAQMKKEDFKPTEAQKRVIVKQLTQLRQLTVKVDTEIDVEAK